MVKIQTNLNNFSVSNELLAFFSDSEQDYQLIVDKCKILPAISKCPLCSGNLSKNGYNECKDIRAKAFGLTLRKGRVSCSNPDCSFKLNVSQSVLNKWFSKLSDWLESIILSLGTKKLSSSNIADFLRDSIGVSVSDEFVRVRLNKLMRAIKCPDPQEKSSGVVVHDEQFVKIKGVSLKRISTVDANNSNVYYDQLHEDRTEETMKKVCNELNLFEQFHAVVVDGLVASKNAYEKAFVGIIVQYCLFHFAKNVRDAYKDEVGYSKGKSCIPLQYLIGFFCILNIFFDHDREITHLRELQNQLNAHIGRINKSSYPLEKKQDYIDNYKEAYDLKAAKYLKRIRITRRRKNGIKLTLRTEEQAKDLLAEAKKHNVFPKSVQKQINRLEREWINFTHCMRDENIPPTSNKVEQYYAMTLNWIEKNNLQSEEQFYRNQKVSLMRRYKLPLIKEGILSDFLKTTFALILTFAGT